MITIRFLRGEGDFTNLPKSSITWMYPSFSGSYIILDSFPNCSWRNDNDGNLYPCCSSDNDKTAKAFKIVKGLADGIIKEYKTDGELSAMEFIELVEKLAKEI